MDITLKRRFVLQAAAAESGGGARVSLDEDGFADTCFKGLDTKGVMEMVADNFLELRPDDIIVVATQLQDGTITNIKGESKVPGQFSMKAS